MTEPSSSTPAARPTAEPPAEVRLPSRWPLAWRACWPYAAIAVLTVVAALWAMQVSWADLRVPFGYDGDAMLNLTLIKSILDKGWYVHNADLGVPAGMNLLDYPVGDNLDSVIFKAFGFFTHDPILIDNLFFLLTFPLIGIAAVFAARQFGVSTGPALLTGGLYAVLPYHFFRGTYHLYFSGYFLVPLAVLIAWWISSGQLAAPRWRGWFSLGVCALLGCSVPYYPFFACFFFLVAGVLALFWSRPAHFLAALGLIAVVVTVLLLNLLPELLYMRVYGHTAGERLSMESEMFGLKIAQLLLPVSGHRVPALAAFKAVYNRSHPLVNENDWVSLGFIGGAGFLVLIGWTLFARRRALAATTVASPAARAAEVLEHLGVFNVAAILLATIGGFSSLFAELVTPQIRGFNRISVFIAFFSLLAVALGLDLIARRWVRSLSGTLVFGVVLVALGWLGLLDQTGADASRNWSALKSSYRNDLEFFSRVQTALPPGSLVFELPYEPFPEYGLMINQMPEYSLFKPYLLTHGLRWSYGVIKGRPGDLWEQNAAAQPPEQMLATLRRAGFAGLYIDRSAYTDRAAALEANLRALLGNEPLTDLQGKFSLFKLPAPPVPALSLEALLPLQTPVWNKGFYDLETAADHTLTWRWCAEDGEVHCLNESPGVRRVRLQGTLHTATGQPANLQIRSRVLQADLVIDPAGTVLSRDIELPPGATNFDFHCDGKPAPPNAGDPRSLVWRIDNPSLEVLP